MKARLRKSKHAQNRIAYIVYNDPRAIRRLIDDQGFDPPENDHDLVKATKQLVRRRGRKVVKELLKVHPDRKAILRLEKIKEDSFCGACNNYSYDAEDNHCGACGHSNYAGAADKGNFLQQLLEMGMQELETLYDNTVKKSNKAPSDNNLAEEVRLIWNELRLRKKQGLLPSKTVEITDASEPKNSGLSISPKQGLLLLSLTLTSGILIGTAWKFKTQAV